MKILSITILSWFALVGSCSNERYTTKIENLKNGLNVCQGKVTYKAVATELDYEYVSPDTMI